MRRERWEEVDEGGADMVGEGEEGRRRADQRRRAGEKALTSCLEPAANSVVVVEACKMKRSRETLLETSGTTRTRFVRLATA